MIYVFKWYATVATLDIPNKQHLILHIFLVSSANIILQENASGRAGLKSDLSLICTACDESTSLQTSANITKRGKSFDVNKRAVYHSLESGTGYEGLASFCGIMNMPCMSSCSYYKHVDSILSIVEDYTKEELISAGQRLRNIILDENPFVTLKELLMRLGDSDWLP